MTPLPREPRQDANAGGIPPAANSQRIVISGMSGLYPQSRNIKEFSEILYNKINPVTSVDSRWDYKHPEVVNTLGKVSDLDRFDAQFFKVHYRLANNMDPMARKLLELAYEAIYDAGLSPAQLNGKKIGVFIGSSLSETENKGFYRMKSKHGFTITGISKTMYANRISYWLNIKGPSHTIDGSCCSSTVALEQAISAINRGDCEAAIVGSSNLCLHPQTMVNYKRCIALAPDGKTKSFAENADGLARSDAINMLYLQKASDALRIYAEIVGVKNTFISTIPSKMGQLFEFNRHLDVSAAFLKQFYDKANVSPQAVEYVEAFGSASPEADKTELQAIEKVFCQNRSEPLLVGSVMSNVGYTDCASGITAITKVLLGYHKRVIAGNLHCEKPRQDVDALRDGKMVIVRENQPFKSTYASVNGLSVTGINSHVLLNGNFKPKDISRYKSSIPRLVTISSREEQTLPKILEDLKSRPVDPEEIALFHNIHSNNISGHLGRGYIILDTDSENKTVCLAENSEYNNDAQRPLWFVYSGMGSQWVGMGEKLMRIPIFAAAIEKCHKVLKPKGIDIVHVISSSDKAVFDNILYSFVGIAAIQIGLTDVLREIGLKPDKIIGHSVGELGCAYADGCLTAEEMILSAYSRGLVSLQTKFIRGAMAAIGLGYEKVSGLCPPEIVVACHNSRESCTISGPADKVKEFVSKLTEDGVFAKEVPCSNIAYHSPYIAAAGPSLFKYLSEIITDPKARSDRWVSTSVPQQKWHEPHAKFCSAEYLTNNLLSPVLFEEASKLVPYNAVLVEIAPHGLLQAILKRSLPADCKNISLTKRGHPDNAVHLLEALGKIYIEGFTPRIQALYPKVEFPVSTGTPHLSHHVEWMHSEQWYVSKHIKTVVKNASTCNFLINPHDDEYSYLKGNVVGGKVLYPYSAALVAVWDTLAMTLGEKKKEVSVQFRDVHLYNQPIIQDQRPLKISVSFHRGNGNFFVTEGSTTVASGWITTYEPIASRNELNAEYKQDLTINSKEVYQNLNSRGYAYTDEFRTIHRVNENITEAQILYNKWTVAIDGMLQLNILKQPFSGKVDPCRIRELTIDVEQHYASSKQLSANTKTVLAKIDNLLETTTCGGIVMKNVQLRDISIDNLDITLNLENFNTTIEENDITLDKPTIGKNFALQISKIGDINSLNWEEADDKSLPGIKVKVHYAGLNVTDMKKATGVISFKDDEKYFGMDYSGLTERGDRVMGLVKNGSVSTYIKAQPDLIWPIPAHWSLEEAATVPLAYLQAFYCLNIKNQLAKHSIVLIHGGAGALGQAAISIALANGCQVFTTVSELSKKRFLRRLFPQLKDEHIVNSRDPSFGDYVLSATNGFGCDIVLSCVEGKLRNDCLKCTAHMGTMIDTSLLQSRENYEYGMAYMTKSRSFMAVDFHSLFDPKNSAVTKTLQVLMSEGIAGGFVRPLTRVAYTPDQAAQAFSLLAASRHRGRVLIRMQEAHLLTQPKIMCTPNNSHIIIWNSNSSGLLLADTLIARGATNILLHYLHTTSYHSLKFQLWKNLGINVQVSFGNLSNSAETQKLLKKANDSGPIEGIYVIDTDSDSTSVKLPSVISQIIDASRNSYPLLKYFSVTTTNNEIAEYATLSKSQEHLPQILIIPDVKRVNEHYGLMVDDSTWNRLTIDAVERALLWKHRILAAKPQISDSLLLRQLSEITGLNLRDFKDDTTLKDLRVESDVLHKIKSYLNDSVIATLDAKDVLGLTKHRIRQMELDALRNNFREVKGLDTFFSYVDPDELRGSTDLVLLDTLVTTLIDEELDLRDTTYMTIVPGLEGGHERFRSMAELLKLPAVVLQPTLDSPHETPKDLALRYSKVLLNKLGMPDTFYLFGYECGVTVALELAAILEAHGKTGVVFCVGGGPDSIQAQVKQQLKEYQSEEALQASIIAHMFKLMSVDDMMQLESAMQNCSSWKERVVACVSVLLGKASHSAQYVTAVIEAAYARLNIARTYRFTPQKLRSKIVVLRAKSSTPDDSSLQQFSVQPIAVHDLDAPLGHATEDLGCVAAVNRYLSQEVLKRYAEYNLCESYVAYK